MAKPIQQTLTEWILSAPDQREVQWTFYRGRHNVELRYGRRQHCPSCDEEIDSVYGEGDTYEEAAADAYRQWVLA